MNNEIFYTPMMQLVLFFVGVIYYIFIIFISANLIISILETPPKRKNQILKIIFFYSCASLLLIYSLYFINGRKNFSDVFYAVSSIPNPLITIIYYLVSHKMLGFSKIRAIYFMNLVYMYLIFLSSFNLFVRYAFFYQNPIERYNYFKEILFIFASVIIQSVFYITAKIVCKNFHIIVLKYTESVNKKNIAANLIKGFIYSLCLYLFTVLYPILSKSFIAGSLHVVFILLLVLITNLLIRFSNTMKNQLENKDIFIKSLTESADEFAGLRHDFNNILQTYGGYLTIREYDKLKDYHKTVYNKTKFAGEEIELNEKLSRNMDFAELIFVKTNEMNSKEIKFSLSIFCDISYMNIETAVLCYIVSEILDLAIHQAQDSKNKHISLSIKEKPDKSKLVIITAGYHRIYSEKKLAEFIKKYLSYYKNAFFHIYRDKNDIVLFIQLYPKI